MRRNGSEIVKKSSIKMMLIGVIWIIVGMFFDVIIQLLGVLTSKFLGAVSGVGRNTFGPISASVVMMMVLTACAFWVIAKWGIRPYSPNFGFHRVQGEKIIWILWGYLMVLGVGAVLGIIQTLLKGSVEVAQNQQSLEEMAKQGPGALAFVLALSVLVAPFLEEIIFRGVVLNYFFKGSNWWINVILSGVLFGYFHLAGYGGFDILAFLQYSSMGIVLAVVYKKTKQIQYSIGLHMLNNSIAAIMLIAMALNVK